MLFINNNTYINGTGLYNTLVYNRICLTWTNIKFLINFVLIYRSKDKNKHDKIHLVTTDIIFTTGYIKSIPYPIKVHIMHTPHSLLYIQKVILHSAFSHSWLPFPLYYHYNLMFLARHVKEMLVAVVEMNGVLMRPKWIQSF